ncbi:MAG: acyl carrier protein [Peptostreptococcaceae bacterium]|nr:acyl carrier protein [Peptostreptococcaceae bacterium]
MIEKVKEILAKELDLELSEIKPESDIQEDLGADSLAVMEIVMALEEEFDIEIPDSVTSKIKTVKDILDYLEANA